MGHTLSVFVRIPPKASLRAVKGTRGVLDLARQLGPIN